jgi:hypothetical protein
MDIIYTYKILKVDEENKTMEVQYAHEEFGLIHTFTRIPYEDETLEMVISMYSPVAFWLEKTKKRQKVQEDTNPKTMTWTDGLNQSDKEAEVRMFRNQLLAMSDYTQLEDAPASINKEAWAAYRQELRNITMQSVFPDNIVWPVIPN